MSPSQIIHIFADVCLPVFVSVGLGWMLDRRFRLHLESMVKLNIYLMVPAFIFTRVMATELSGQESLRIVVFTCAVIALMFVCSLVAGRVFRFTAGQKQALSLATMFYNSGNFGLPLVTLAFGHAAAAVQIYVLATMNVATFTVGLFLAQSHGDAPGKHRRALLSVLRQPTLYAVVAGLLCHGMGWPVQHVTWIWKPLELLSDCLIGFALVTLGVQMSQTKPAPFRAPLWSAMVIRLALAPVVAALLAKAFGFSPQTSASLILAAGAPTAVNTALLAHEFGGDISFATSAVYYSTLFSLLTTTVVLTVLRMWLGV